MQFSRGNKRRSSSSSCQKFSLGEIKMATNEFAVKNFLGSGAFGKVYRGHISGNSYNGDVAVKRLDKESNQGTSEFEKEIDLLSACHQANIISLVGYCDERDEKILVYEFMPNGSLYSCLYQDKDGACRLTVEQRLEICIGVANGLTYLHSGIDYNIIHSDLKSDNILLDCNLVAKISDFGLSRTRAVGPFSSEQITNSVRGTEGCVAPECYESNYKPSRKADVYAFGILLLEVLCERPPWKRLVILALPFVMKGELPKFTPPYVEANISPECSRACENLIRDCLETDPDKRPSMSRVVDDLGLALKLQKQNRDGKGQNNKSQANRQRVGSELLPWTNPKVFSSRNDLVVLYYTSIGVVLQTQDKCRDVRRILDGYGKRVDERDLYLDPLYRNQMRDIFGPRKYTLPQLFIGGNHVGGADEIVKLHWSGELRTKLERVPKRDYPSFCSVCGNSRFVPCRKGVCKECNENGLARCPTCCFWKSD